MANIKMGCAEHRMIETRTEKEEKTYTFLNQFTMYAAIKAKKTSEVEQHLNNGFDPNARMVNFLKRTPLHIAAETGAEEIVSLLLKNSANPNICDEKNITPICLALKNRHRNVVTLLQNRGASLQIKTKHNLKLRDFIPQDDKKFYAKIVRKNKFSTSFD